MRKDKRTESRERRSRGDRGAQIGRFRKEKKHTAPVRVKLIERQLSAPNVHTGRSVERRPERAADEAAAPSPAAVGESQEAVVLQAMRQMIARTETHAAANYASTESVRAAGEKLGVKMLKEWLPTIDGRTRPAHAEMAGSDPIPMDDKFLVNGEEMDRPGDPGASPDNVINCRCVLGYSEAE